jgi:hypothetical protein
MFALPESKVSSAELLFTSFVKKGKGINRTATALATGQVERRLFSPPEGVACCQHQMPFSSTQGPVQLGKQKKTHGSTTSNIYCAFFTTRYCQTPLGAGCRTLFLSEMLKYQTLKYISEFRTSVFTSYFYLVPRRNYRTQLRVNMLRL